METFHSTRWAQPFMPDRITLDDERVTVTKRKMFGLRSVVEEVRYDRVASVRLSGGMFWSSLTVETAGGSVSDLAISGLPKRHAVRAADRIRAASSV